MLQDGEWVDISFELTRQQDVIVPESGDSYAFAAEARGNESSLVAMPEGDTSINWTLVGSDEAQQPRPLTAAAAVITDTAVLAESAYAKLDAAAESQMLTLEALQQKAERIENTRFVEKARQEELAALNEEIDAYNRQFLNRVSFAESAVTYPDALGEGVDVRYTASKGRIKEEVIVRSPGLLTGYTAVIQLNGLQAADEQGGIAYTDEDGRVVFTTAPPLMYDNNGIPSEDIEVILEIRGGAAHVTYTPDPAWLEAPERTYPVVLNPLYTNTVAQTAQVDTYVHSGNTSSGQNDSLTTMYVGNRPVSGTRRPHYAYWRIKRANMPQLPANTYITSATFSARLVNGTTSRGAIQLYAVNSDAGEWSSGNMLWSGKPAFGPLLQTWAANSSLSSNALTLSGTVTDTVIGWYANSQSTNTGFVFKYSFEDYADHNAMYSSDYRGTNYLECIPQLVIHYASPTRPIADGVYFIRNRMSGMYLDLTGNGVTNGTLVQQFPGGDHPSEMWKVTYLPSTGNYRIESCLAEGKALDSCGESSARPGTRTVLWTVDGNPEQRWLIQPKGTGYYYVSPEINYQLAIQVEGGSMYSNAKIAVSEKDFSQTQQWYFESVNIGNGGGYRPISTVKPNCFGYALKINQSVDLPVNPFNESHYTEDHISGIESALSDHVNYRQLASHVDVIQNNEYRIAIRVSNGINGWIFHVIYQLSDGSWARKNHTGPSKQLGWGDPSITPRMWETDLFPEWCGTVYYAIWPK